MWTEGFVFDNDILDGFFSETCEPLLVTLPELLMGLRFGGSCED